MKESAIRNPQFPTGLKGDANGEHRIRLQKRTDQCSTITATRR